MKRSLALSAPIMALVLFLTPAVSLADKDLFLKNKCEKCHEIKSLGVASSKKSGTPVDLSGVGKEHDVAFFKDFIAKKIEHKPHAGQDAKKHSKKHKKKWSGSDADLTKLAEFAASLK